jgi:hypothetical protein
MVVPPQSEMIPMMHPFPIGNLPIGNVPIANRPVGAGPLFGLNLPRTLSPRPVPFPRPGSVEIVGADPRA